MELTYKYRIYPTKQQVSDIRNICGAARFLYNKLLEERTQHYREKRQWKKLDSKPFIEFFPFLAQTDPGALAWAVNRLDRAYRHFFFVEKTEMDRYRPEAIAKNKMDKKYALLDTDLVCYPQYKRKKDTKESYTTVLKNVNVEKKRILLPVLGRVKIAYHRQIPKNAQLLDCTILKNKAGKYFILLRLALPEAPKKELQTALGMVFVPGGPIAMRSDGYGVCIRHQTPQQTKRMEQAYKTLCRRVYGSRRYEVQRKYLASLYEKRANQRRDDLHKAARQITNAADVLYLQKPDVRKQAAQQKTARARAEIWDEAWYALYSNVRYKAEQEGKRFWGVPENFPTYHFCSGCGTFKKDPEENQWMCPECGLQMDKAVNAATNLKHMAEKYIREQRELAQR